LWTIRSFDRKTCPTKVPLYGGFVIPTFRLSGAYFAAFSGSEGGATFVWGFW
jgi:hypothetical protein